MNITQRVAAALTLAATTTLLANATMPTTATASGQEGKRIVLGDLDPKIDAKSVGAPFDPCELGWSAFPAEVRPEKDTKPRLRAPKEGDPFSTACRYDNGAKASAQISPNAGQATVGKNFIVLIVWAKPGLMKTAQAEQPGSTPQQFGNKAGLIKPGTNKTSKEPTCTGIIPLSNGVAGINITNGRFPTDTCAIVKTLGEAIAGKTS
ncbi:hypothetical protein FKR81_37475 [Lentzea tibetensis]|uniref:DUF3558 domain-containing protein n=1 Tax=Lentzea tibetensis TaxID=2591470 RepID=A0A563EHW1_9PSEU|nr:hypothetical protein [Lentzea tibetensis]TWP46061.1 hypothetical protein FKR81_37475 [Lentzea tibetensis]